MRADKTILSKPRKGVKQMKALHSITLILLFIGGLNWLLVAFGWDLVEMVFIAGSTLTMIV